MYFIGTKCRLFILSSFLLSTSLFAKDIKTVSAAGLQKPLCFVENKGQVMDEQQHYRNDIQYKLSTPGMNLFVGNGQLHYQFKKADAGTTDPMISAYRMDVALIGANVHAPVTATEQLGYYENFYLSQLNNNGITARAYARITYKDVYPNIDWVIYVKNGQVEYDFVVREGGNANDIQLKYGGATALSITADGGILAKTPMGNVAEHQPLAYETATGKTIASSFKLHDNVVSFATAEHKGSLTIDPYLEWSTYFGGASEDVATGIAIGPDGSTYVCGYTTSTSGLSAGGGIYQSTYGGGTYDAFLAKYSTAGTLLFATYYGGSNTDKAMGVAADAAGIYVVGNTMSAGLATAGSDQHTNSGANDIFLVKFTPTGGRSWATYEGGPSNDFGTSVACSGSGNVYIGGLTTSATGIATAGAYQTTIGSALITDGYLAKFNELTGAKSWATYYGGSATDEIDGIATDTSNNIIITGKTSSVLSIASAGSYQSAFGGTNDAFIAKFTPAGTRQWGTYYGGTGADQSNGVATDSMNNIYIIGTTLSSDGIAAGSSYQNTFGGTSDAFLAKFTTTGAIRWATYFGGSDIEYGQAVATDRFGNIVITGATFSNSGVATSQGFQTTLGGDFDAYYAKFNTHGQNLYASYFGKSFYDYAYAIATDKTTATMNSNVIIAGKTSSTDISSTGAAQAAFGGGSYDAFVTRFSSDTLVTIRQPYTDTIVCQGGVLTVHDTTTYSFNSDNTFTVQLSDAAGSFATPVTIGSMVASNPGDIICIIPAGTPAGTGYRIRITSSSPAYTSPDDAINIQINATLPAPALSATSPVCEGQPIDLFFTAPYAVNSYSWTGPNSFTSTDQNPVVTTSATLLNAGTYSVTITHNGCADMTSTIPVAVSTVIPPAPIDSATTPICSGTDLKLFARSGMTGTFTYYWTGPGGFTTTTQNPVIPAATLSNAGTYTVIDTLAGCASPASTIVVSINPIDTPNIIINVAPNDTVCINDLVSFTAVTTNAGVSPQYQWMKGTAPIVGAIFSTYSSPFLTSTSNIYCILTNDISCPDKLKDTSNIIDMTVVDNTPAVHIVAIPDTNVEVGTTVFFNGFTGSLNVTGYQWYVNGIAITGATSTSFVLPTVSNNDTVQFQVTTSDSCANTGVSNTVVVHVFPLGVANIPSAFSVELYPNPNSGSFVVKGTTESIDGSVSIVITNAVGQVIYNDNANITGRTINHTVDMHNVPAGVYMLHIEKDGASKVIRFVVE